MHCTVIVLSITACAQCSSRRSSCFARPSQKQRIQSLGRTCLPTFQAGIKFPEGSRELPSDTLGPSCASGCVGPRRPNDTSAILVKRSLSSTLNICCAARSRQQFPDVRGKPPIIGFNDSSDLARKIIILRSSRISAGAADDSLIKNNTFVPPERRPI
jgi:hypothetical protein